MLYIYAQSEETIACRPGSCNSYIYNSYCVDRASIIVLYTYNCILLPEKFVVFPSMHDLQKDSWLT